MNWVERTFWLSRQDTGELTQAVVVDEGADPLLDLEETGFSITASPKQHPCSTCPHKMSCMSSRWADSKRMGGPCDPAPLSLVMLCPTCSETVLILGGSSLVVPTNCPRQNETDIDCPLCENPETLIQAQWVVGRLLNDAESRFAFFATMTMEKRTAFLDSCLRIIQTDLKNDPNNYAGIVSTFMAEVNHAATFHVPRFAFSLSERKFIRRVWEGIVKETLVGLCHTVTGTAEG